MIMNNWIIYTDGAYSTLRNVGGVGLVFIKDNTKIFEWSKSIVNTTNNRCELYAVIKALQAISKPINSLIIYSDSQYVIGTITKGWQRKKNQDLWKSFDRMYAKAQRYCKDIKFEWVKGHDTNDWNNRCDYLAVEASHEYSN